MLKETLKDYLKEWLELSSYIHGWKIVSKGGKETIKIRYIEKLKMFSKINSYFLSF